MRRVLFEVLAALLLGAAVWFFHDAVGFVTRRDYVGAALVAGFALVVIQVGAELARLALAGRR